MENKEKLDYKKEYKELYFPEKQPIAIEVPEIIFIMVDGKGNPNEEDGEYKNALNILYGMSFTIKMSKRNNNKPKDYFEYVVPPLEGLWWADGILEKSEFYKIDKEKFQWTSMIRQPEFVTEDVYEWALKELKKKKPDLDYSKVRYSKFKEGLCVQAMHIGLYDNEKETIQKIERFIEEQGYKNDLGEERRHHEIYLGDPRKTKTENLKTVIRIPVRRV